MKALAFSGGKDSMACLHLLRDELSFGIFVDTGVTYPETWDMVRYAETMIPIHVVSSDRVSQNAIEGIPSDIVPVNWTKIGQAMTTKKPVLVQSYLQCCYQNLAIPLTRKALELGVTELVYGQRDSESHRSVAHDGSDVMGITRLHPIEGWTAEQVLDYLAGKMEVPAHYAINHSSLDCYDCTGYRSDSLDRIAWTKSKHPAFHAAFQSRDQLLTESLRSALSQQEGIL